MTPFGAAVFRQTMNRIFDERNRQDRKWGVQRLNPDRWITILVEEVGEAANAVNEADWENLEVELVQVAAVSVAWLTAIRLAQLEAER